MLIDLYTVCGFDNLLCRYVLFYANTLRTCNVRPRSPRIPTQRECDAAFDVPIHPLTTTELCRLQLTSILYIDTPGKEGVQT